MKKDKVNILICFWNAIGIFAVLFCFGEIFWVRTNAQAANNL